MATDPFVLIERLEKATGPDRELDVAIVYALHPDIGNYAPGCIGDPPIFWHDPYRKQPCPAFTASIDAALTLVPEGLFINMDFGGLTSAKAYACLCRSNSASTPDPEFDGRGATPAIALCIAALRARSATP